jgi:SAM-dependent methyltransferase
VADAKPSALRRVQLKLRKRFPSQKARRHELVGPAHFWKEKRAFQIDFLKRQGLAPTDTLVDIGCGTLRGGVPLIEYLDAGNYAGVDVRTEVEGEARSELVENHLEGKSPALSFGQGLPELHLGRQFDCAWAFAVLFHLTDEHLEECFAFVREHLKPTGCFYANANVGQHTPDTWREFPVIWRPLAHYETSAAAVGLRCEDLGSLGSLGHDFTGQAQRMLRFTF